MSVCCDATLLRDREVEYAWHLLARIKEPIFEWPGCDQCKHVMIFNPGKNVIIRVLHWYPCHPITSQYSSSPPITAPSLDIPGPGQEMFVTALWPVLTLQGSAIQILHSDIICALHNDPAWQTITGPLSSGSWGIWCHTDHPHVQERWIKFGRTKTTEITSGHISPKTSSDWVFVMINASVSSVLGWDLAISAQIQHKTIHCSGHLSSPMSHCVESKKWIEKGGRFSDSVKSFLAFSIQGFRDQRFGDTGDADNGLAPYKSPTNLP